MTQPSIDEQARAQFTSAPVTVSLSGASAASAALTLEGTYWLTTDTDCFWLQGGSTVTATTASIPLWAKTYLGPVYINAAANQYIAGITAGATGTLYLIPVMG